MKLEFYHLGGDLICKLFSDFVPSLGDYVDITEDDVWRGKFKVMKITRKFSPKEQTVIVEVYNDSEDGIKSEF